MSDIIISTRVRLARNLKDYPFPCKLSEQGKQKVSENVRAAITQSNSALQNDLGMRIDYIFVSPSLADRLQKCDIDRDKGCFLTEPRSDRHAERHTYHV